MKVVRFLYTLLAIFLLLSTCALQIFDLESSVLAKLVGAPFAIIVLISVGALFAREGKKFALQGNVAKDLIYTGGLIVTGINFAGIMSSEFFWRVATFIICLGLSVFSAEIGLTVDKLWLFQNKK